MTGARQKNDVPLFHVAGLFTEFLYLWLNLFLT